MGDSVPVKMYAAIVVTCSDQASANAYLGELKLRQEKLLIHPDTVVLCVVDPMPNIGSGGATLNAIYNITEHISALKGCTVISGDMLQDQRILILHMGTTTPYSACTPGFLPWPASVETSNEMGFRSSGLATQFDMLLQLTMNVLARESPPGFWVCSCDRVISIPQDATVDWSVPASVRLFTVPMDVVTAANQHGVARIGDNNIVEDIIYKGSESALERCVLNDTSVVPAVCGIVFFETQIVDALLNLCVVPPLDNYTYLALDDGYRPLTARPLASEKADIYRDNDAFILSLFFDILLSLASTISRDEFIMGIRGGIYGTAVYPDLNSDDNHVRKQIRQVLWDTLHGKITLKAEFLSNSEFHYLSHDASIIHQLLLRCPYPESSEVSRTKIHFSRQTSPLSLHSSTCSFKNNVLVNTRLGSRVTIGDCNVLLHSNIVSDCSIGNNSMIINIEPSDLRELQQNFELPDNIVFQSLHLKMSSELSTSVKRVLVMFGIHDKLKQDISSPGCTIFNQPWDDFFNRTTILPSEIWSPEVPVTKRCLLTARLFPLFHPKGLVTIHHLLWLQGSHTCRNSANFWRTSWKLSLAEILDLCDPSSELSRRRDLYFDIGQKELEQSLLQKLDICFIPFFQSCITDGYFERTLVVLDNVAKTSADPAVVSRSLACIADVLGVKAGRVGGLRSGPAANLLWKPGLSLIKENKIPEAIDYMASQRPNWYVSPDLLVRAARHYEGAFQIQVRKAVASARQFIKLEKGAVVPMDTWVTATCPARADISGTWSDTPPICYEQGGSVVTLAISIDQKKPIGCRVKRIAQPKIILLIGRDEDVKVECEEFDDLMNFSQPNIPGALLKAAFFCAEVLPLHNRPPSLAECLMQLYGGGFLLHTWSNLPYGSGLGTSSILAGAIISALWTVVGQGHDIDSVVHAVLDLEQMLTTGGGWQDQVGGLYPGVKIGSSAKALPLHVVTSDISMPPGFKGILENHLLVVFTGKTRLARNMLQDVLRNWNARSPEIVETAKLLKSNAEECTGCLQRGDLDGIGKCLNDCWTFKKTMAHGCEPNIVRSMMDAFQPHVYGQCLLGAGGGGFMIIITREENASKSIYHELELLHLTDKATLHNATIDEDGLQVVIGTEMMNSEQ